MAPPELGASSSLRKLGAPIQLCNEPREMKANDILYVLSMPTRATAT